MHPPKIKICNTIAKWSLLDSIYNFTSNYSVQRWPNIDNLKMIFWHGYDAKCTSSNNELSVAEFSQRTERQKALQAKSYFFVSLTTSLNVCSFNFYVFALVVFLKKVNKLLDLQHACWLIWYVVRVSKFHVPVVFFLIQK